eukprot:2070711-Amphidinium_carterae.2
MSMHPRFDGCTGILSAHMHCLCGVLSLQARAHMDTVLRLISDSAMWWKVFYTSRWASDFAAIFASAEASVGRLTQTGTSSHSTKAQIPKLLSRKVSK